MTSARLGRLLSPERDHDQDSPTGRIPMIEPDTENSSPALEEAARELQAAQHDAQVAFDCIALGELERAHEHALTARVAADAAVTALAAALGQPRD
jgi:hypothetical protein